MIFDFMAISNILYFLFAFSFLSILLFYSGFYVLLYYYHKRSQFSAKEIAFTYPTVSLIVPVYNEEKIVSKKIQNIEELNYPNDKLEVIFIDGHSTDQTCNLILNKSINSQKSIKLIRQETRQGYTRAMIEGVMQSKNEIIVASDAASYHYPDAIRHLVKHFTNPEIGAVTGKEVVLGDSKKLGPQMEKSYRFFYDFMRQAETEIDSTPDTKGEILAVRREIGIQLIKNLHLSPNASFDSCVPYQAKLMGFRTIYEEQAQYYERSPSSFSDRMTQQIRRATLLIGAMILYKELLMNKKSGKFGRLILPIHFIMHCILPSIFLLGLISFVIVTPLIPLATLPVWIVLLLALIFSKSRNFILSFTQAQFSLIIALFRLAKRKQSLFIESIPSTREST